MNRLEGSSSEEDFRPLPESSVKLASMEFGSMLGGFILCHSTLLKERPHLVVFLEVWLSISFLFFGITL
jgi:hypothetical protein